MGSGNRQTPISNGPDRGFGFRREVVSALISQKGCGSNHLPPVTQGDVRRIAAVAVSGGQRDDMRSDRC